MTSVGKVAGQSMFRGSVAGAGFEPAKVYTDGFTERRRPRPDLQGRRTGWKLPHNFPTTRPGGHREEVRAQTEPEDHLKLAGGPRARPIVDCDAEPPGGGDLVKHARRVDADSVRAEPGERLC